MRHLLVINPNTSDHVSALLQQHLQATVGATMQVRTATARFGAPYIACEASYAVAGHALLDAWAHATTPPQPPADAVVIGCFGDPGLWALRECSPVPVTGLAEAALAEAARLGPFAIVTGGLRWGPMLQRLAQTLGHAHALQAVHTVAPSGAALAANPKAAHQLLAQACRAVVQETGVNAVVLGGAGLAGMAAAIAPEVEVPVIDSVAAAARWALALPPASAPAGQAQFDVEWVGLSEAMQALGASSGGPR